MRVGGNVSESWGACLRVGGVSESWGRGLRVGGVSEKTCWMQWTQPKTKDM